MRTNEFDTYSFASNVLSEKPEYMGKCFAQCFDGFHDGIVNTVDGIFTMLFGRKCFCLLTFRDYLMTFQKVPKEYIDDLLNKVKVMQKLAKKNVNETQEKNEARYDKITKVPKF